MGLKGVRGTECVPLLPPPPLPPPAPPPVLTSPPWEPNERMEERWESSSTLSSAADPTLPPREFPTEFPPLAPDPDWSAASPLVPVATPVPEDGFLFPGLFAGLLRSVDASVVASSMPIPPRPSVANAAPISLLFRECFFLFPLSALAFSRSRSASIRPSNPSAAAPVISNTGGRSGTPPAPPPLVRLE